MNYKCICEILENPCSNSCTCNNGIFSGGCKYCVNYGNNIQKVKKAKFLKEAIDTAWKIEFENNDKTDIILQCKKCDHLIYINWKKFISDYILRDNHDCPECGEDGYENWILIGTGNFAEDYGE